MNGEEFLPEDEGKGEETCPKLEEGDYCFLAGDHRVNVFPGLSALHTVFLRYHNQLCDKLKAKHTGWGDEKLYQEARRIVVAVLQVISYKEYIPKILGSTVTQQYGLSRDTIYSYSSGTDPTLANVFSTAAGRFGHSLISDTLTISGKVIKMGDFFKRPKFVLNSFKSVVEAFIAEPTQTADRWYTSGRLFEKPGRPKSGFDLAARNIQRGRDHELPTYNVWRAHHGLNPITSFDQLPQMSRILFQSVYPSVNDIDLYTGGLTEEPAAGGGRVGDLYAKILAQHFSALKFGDRFWYENTESTGAATFTTSQIEQLNKIQLSRILCHTVPGLTNVQASVMRIVDSRNPVVSCSSLPDIDITRFR